MVFQRPSAFAICALVGAILAACGNQSAPAGKKPSPVVLIKFSRSGGLAGSKVAGTVTFSANHAYVDGKDVPYRRELDAQELKQLRADTEAADLPAAQSALPSGGVPGGYRFEITVVTEDGTSRSLSFGENSMDRLKQLSPAAFRLADWVRREAGEIAGRRI